MSRRYEFFNALLQSGELLLDAEVHDDGYQVNDLQMSQDRTYFITAGKDKQAKVWELSFHS